MAPSHARASVRASVKRWQGYVQAGLLSREIMGFGVPTSLTEAEGNIAGGAIREPSGDPARSKNPGMHGISMRENREVPRSPVGGQRMGLVPTVRIERGPLRGG
jgi:hypothetical protein